MITMAPRSIRVIHPCPYPIIELPTGDRVMLARDGATSATTDQMLSLALRGFRVTHENGRYVTFTDHTTNTSISVDLNA